MSGRRRKTCPLCQTPNLKKLSNHLLQVHKKSGYERRQILQEAKSQSEKIAAPVQQQLPRQANDNYTGGSSGNDASTPMTKENYLQSIYSNPKEASSFSGQTKLWEEIQHQGNPLKLTFNDVKVWLDQQPTHYMYTKPKERFPREKIIVRKIDKQWDGDLMDMQTLRKHNKGIRFIAIFIDLFSRYLWVRPMKTKTGVEMLNVMKDVFGSGRKPSVLRTDQGRFFYLFYLFFIYENNNFIILD